MCRQTSTQELFPLNNVVKNAKSATKKRDGDLADRAEDENDEFVQSALIPHYLNKDVTGWSIEDVQSWLRYFDLAALSGNRDVHISLYPSAHSNFRSLANEHRVCGKAQGRWSGPAALGRGVCLRRPGGQACAATAKADQTHRETERPPKGAQKGIVNLVTTNNRNAYLG